MLSSALAITEYKDGCAIPDRLTRLRHAHYVEYAERMLHLYHAGVGCTRRELHNAVHAVFARETDCPLKRIASFCKLLDEASEFDADRRGQAANLRQEVFRRAAPFHPLLASADRPGCHEESAVKNAIAQQLGQSWDEIDDELFRDIGEFHRLRSFAGYSSPQALLAKYNVAQIQAALFRAVEMVVWATDDFKTIVRQAKLARLMHTIRHQNDSQYEIRFDGPASILRRTRRYGVAMATFLPALIACRGWRMHARLQTPRKGWFVSLDLTANDGLSSHLSPPALFDSQVEADFARRWGEEREGWSLHRESAILHQRQRVFIPDFELRHRDGRKALLEIVGFWTPEYLENKLRTLREFREHEILIAVADALCNQISQAPADVIRYKTRLQPEKVLERLTASKT